MLAGTSAVVRRGAAEGETLAVDADVRPRTESGAEIATHGPAERRYVPVRELGRGGMGLVAEAFDVALGRCVAQKTLLPESDEQHAAMLIGEAQTCAQLEHPSIVPIYDIDASEDGTPFYTMRVVPGRTLRDVLDESRDGKGHSLAQLLGILRQVCLAVDFAHSRGVVHRDLKPDNVIVGEFGEVYVLDWGVAHVTAASKIVRSTPQPAIAGSPGYMAPEQALGEAIDARTDVFALGVILYEMLAGERPFDDVDFRSVRDRIARSAFEPPSHRPSSRSPAAFDALALACLQRDPAARPSSARAFVDAIDAYLDGERAREERAREASEHAAEGEAAREEYETLAAEATRLRAEADAALATIAPWAPAQQKEDAWRLAAHGERLAADAARTLARASAAFTRALGRVANHGPARRGLAALHFRQFEDAEARGDAQQSAQYLELARAYDDGDLALELANRGEIVVESDVAATASVARFLADGLVLRLGPERPLGPTPTVPVLLEAGSYRVRVAREGGAIDYPLLVRRARVQRVEARVRPPIDGMIVIPGGPFLALDDARPPKLGERTIGDFAIAKFPVTFREYARFLDALDDEERARRVPQSPHEGPYLLCADGGWRVSPAVIEGEGRARVPAERELDLPVFAVSWYDALAYVTWLARASGAPYRLPTSLEWEKATRGADGRALPMGHHPDPSFAKLRESRSEASQPEPVGAFPLDESPYGVRDLAGGVGDWTETMGDGDAAPALGDEGTDADTRQAVWRGGAWSTTAIVTPMRYTQMIRARAAWVGFRVAMTLDGPSSALVVEPMTRVDSKRSPGSPGSK